jgi:hypothetical protein
VAIKVLEYEQQGGGDDRADVSTGPAGGEGAIGGESGAAGGGAGDDANSVDSGAGGRRERLEVLLSSQLSHPHIVSGG